MDDNMDYLFNVEYARQQGCTEAELLVMNMVYVDLQNLLETPDEECGTPREAVERLQHLEFFLQYLWKFDMHKKYHRYWFEIDGCTCPKMDNCDRVGTAYKVISKGCPYHCYENPAETWDDERFE